ncbi:MAG: class I SAM-dependent methyltransferase [Bacteroidales bacterium]
MVSELDRYLENNSTELTRTLKWLERETNIRTNHARMLSGPVLGRVLEMTSRMLKPKNILEIGTFTGYSAICLAHGLGPEGHLDAIEINDELESLIREGFSRAGLSEKISLHFGDAKVIITQLKKRYDLIYIDANKREYCLYYDLVFDILNSGGYIIADNVLWDGKVYQEPAPTDAQTKEIIRFNRKVKEDHRVENFILPLRDGLNIIRKL